MTLGKAEYRRRLIAALALKGKLLKDLPDLAAPYGLDRHTAARMGRPGDPLQPNRTVNLVLADALDVPLGWFEERDWRGLLVTDDDLRARALARGGRQLDEDRRQD